MVSNGSVEPLPVDVVNRGKPEKQGHRLVVDDQVFFKKTLSEDIMTGIQLGIRHSVRLALCPNPSKYPQNSKQIEKKKRKVVLNDCK